MKNRKHLLGSVLLVSGLAIGAADAGSKLVSKGRSGYVYQKQQPKEQTVVRQTARTDRQPTTVAFMPREEVRREVRVFRGGRHNPGFKTIRVSSARR